MPSVAATGNEGAGAVSEGARVIAQVAFIAAALTAVHLLVGSLGMAFSWRITVVLTLGATARLLLPIDPYRLMMVTGLAVLALWKPWFALYELPFVTALWLARHRPRLFFTVLITLGLFRVSDPNASKGREITARELLERGVRTVETDLAGQPELQAQMLLVIGDIHHRLGLESRMRPLFERALELRRAVYGDDHLAVAEAEYELGGALLLDGELDAAENDRAVTRILIAKGRCAA